jgi:hypothetical protein
VGANGLHLSPASSDEDWNKVAEEVWQEMISSIGLQGEDLASMVQVAHLDERTDGESFILPTRRPFTEQELNSRPNKVVGLRPCLQLVEAHRVQTPFTRWNEDGDSIVDGCQVEKIVVPVQQADGTISTRITRNIKGFWVQDSWTMWDMNTSYTLIPREYIYHLGEAQRANQLRYISPFYSVCNTIQDFQELLNLEMLAAKDGAEKSTIIYTPTGEVSSASSLRQAAWGVKDVPDANADFKKRTEFYQKVLGGRTLGIKTGDKVEQYKTDRPNVSSREYWLWLISVVCAGLSTSVLLVFPDFSANNQGTKVRLELDVNNELFLKKGRKWRLLYARIWEFIMGWAIKNDPRVKNAPQDWRKVKVYAPRSCNVDRGQDANYGMQIANGTGDFETYYGSRGEDWKSRLSALANQRQFAKELGLELALGKASTSVKVQTTDLEDADEDNPSKPSNPQPQTV